MEGVSKLLPIAALAILTGCGSSETHRVVNRLVSPEQELADLARARDQGVITNAEYDALRRKVSGMR